MIHFTYIYIIANNWFNQVNKKQSESRVSVDSGNQKTQHETYDNP